MWWIIIIGCILLFIVYLLLAPFFIEIDSTSGICRIRFHKLFSVNVTMKENSLFLQVKVAAWKREFDLLHPKKKKHEPDKLIEKLIAHHDKERNLNPGKMIGKGIGVMKSFRLRTCYINIDTGDMPLNGILFPWCYLLSRRIGKTVMINFNGENEIILQIENTVARMLWAFFKS